MTDTSLLASTLASGRDAVTLDAALIAKATQLVGDFAVNLTLAILILIATVIASRWAASAARKGLGRVSAFRRDSTVLSFAVQIVRVAVLILGLIAVLQRLGVQTTSIIAVLGAASLAVGLALQGTLSNVAAGVMLLILRPYRVGDVVDIGGVTASVQKLDLFTTQLSNASNHKIVVPNSLVLGDRILNFSGQTRRRVEIDFTVGYGEDLKAAREARSRGEAAREGHAGSAGLVGRDRAAGQRGPDHPARLGPVRGLVANPGGHHAGRQGSSG